MLSNYSLIEGRIKKLHQFVLKALREKSSLSVIPYLKKEAEILHIVSLDWSNKHSGRHIGKVVLDIDPKDLVNIVELANGSWNSFKEDLVKFAVTLALVSEPFALSDPNSLQELLAYLWRSENRLPCINIFAPLLIGSKKSIKWFNDQQGLETVFGNIDALINKEGGHAELTSYLSFLSDLCYSQEWKHLISASKFNLNAFKKLMVSPEKIGGAAQRELRKALVEFVVKSTVGTEGEKTLANLLIESLDTLGTQPNNEYFMETEVFLPILNSYSSVPVCLQPYNEITKRFIKNANEVLLRDDGSAVIEDPKPSAASNPATGGGPAHKQEHLKPNSQLLSKEMQQALSKLCPKDVNMQLAYSQLQDGLVPAFQTIKSRLLGNSFLILVHAKQEKGPDVVVGAYYQHE